MRPDTFLFSVLKIDYKSNNFADPQFSVRSFHSHFDTSFRAEEEPVTYEGSAEEMKGEQTEGKWSRE